MKVKFILIGIISAFRNARTTMIDINKFKEAKFEFILLSFVAIPCVVFASFFAVKTGVKSLM